jgi:hypothetical protein
MDPTQTICAVVWAVLAYGSVAFGLVLGLGCAAAFTRRRLAGRPGADFAAWEREIERMP